MIADRTTPLPRLLNFQLSSSFFFFVHSDDRDASSAPANLGTVYFMAELTVAFHQLSSVDSDVNCYS